MSGPSTLVTACPICLLIPQKSALVTSQGELLPAGADRLQTVAPDLRACPDCGTCYYYSLDEDPGEPMVMASATTTLLRYTPWRALRVLKEMAGSDIRFRERFEQAQAQYDTLMARLIGALSDPTPLPNWHVKKLVVEAVTDHCLDRGDWASIRTVLLKAANPVVRVEAASDFLHVATEEHAVWCVRFFTGSQQKQAADTLQRYEDAVPTLVDTMVEGLEHDDASFDLDSFLGYRNVTIRYTAYQALGNAQYRKLDIGPALPRLARLLESPDKETRSIAARFLKECIEKDARYAAALSASLLETPGATEESGDIRGRCGLGPPPRTRRRTTRRAT